MMFYRIWSTFPALGQCSRTLLKFRGNARTVRRRRKFREFMMFDRIWSTFPALGQCSRSLLKFRGKCQNCQLPAAVENFENLRFLIEFGALFQQSDNGRSLKLKFPEKKNRTATAGEFFQNLRFLIECGVLFHFQQSDNGRSFLMFPEK